MITIRLFTNELVNLFQKQNRTQKIYRFMRRLPLRKRKNRKVGRHERHLPYVQIHHIIRLHTNCIWQLSRKHHNTKTLIIKRFVVHAFYSRTVSFLASKTRTQALGNHVKHQDSSNLLSTPTNKITGIQFEQG